MEWSSAPLHKSSPDQRAGFFTKEKTLSDCQAGVRRLLVATAIVVTVVKKLEVRREMINNPN